MKKSKKLTLNELRSLISIVRHSNIIPIDMQLSIINKLYNKRKICCKNISKRILNNIKKYNLQGN